MDCLYCMMYKSLYAVIIGLTMHGNLLCQDLTSAKSQISKRHTIEKRGMIALGTWAASNIAVNGALLIGDPQNDRDRHFFQMNLAWGLVNGVLAGAGLLSTRNRSGEVAALGKAVKQQSRVEKIFLINSGLDVAYIVGGFYMKEVGKNNENNGALWTGFGDAVILQGGFLLIFDLTMYLLHKRNGQALYGILNNFTLTSSGIGYRMRF